MNELWPAVDRLKKRRDTLKADLARVQALNVDLCERVAAASHALTISAERQGAQAREIGRLRLMIAKAREYALDHVPDPWDGELIQILGVKL